MQRSRWRGAVGGVAASGNLALVNQEGSFTLSSSWVGVRDAAGRGLPGEVPAPQGCGRKCRLAPQWGP